MKIVQVMLAKGFGGAERSFVDLCCALAARDHEILAVCHQHFCERDSLTDHPNIQLHPIPVYGSWDRLAARRIAHIARDFNAEILQAHLARGAHLTGRAARTIDVPLIVKIHNYVDLKYYTRVDTLVATTSSQRRYLQGLGVTPERIAVIPNFSRITAEPCKPRDPNTAPTLVSYGRMVKKKGFDILLDAFAKIINQGVDARLVIGGDGPERRALEARVRDLQLDERVSFAGWIVDVVEFLQSGDIFVLPSLDEPFGIAVLEAMACATPIVATLTAGPKEILTDDLAYLAPPGEVEPLCRALLEALGDGVTRRDKARAAQEEFKCRYSEDLVVPQYLAEYQKLARS